MSTLRSLAVLVVLACSSLDTFAQCPWPAGVGLDAPGGPALELFGYPIALSGDDAIVGAPMDHTAPGGSVYVLRRSGSNWSVVTKLTPTIAPVNVAFGASVALSGDRIVVGAPYENAKGYHTGAAYVFARSGGVWTEVAHLVASNAFRRDYFGSAVALDGTTALIGAYGSTVASIHYNGAAYFFEEVGGVWSETQKVVPTPGGERALFGRATALEGNVAVIGAPFEDQPLFDSGAAYVFERGANGWSLKTKLLPGAPETHGVFGSAVSVSGNLLLVGESHYDDGKQHFGLGSVYVFRDMGANWVQTDELSPADGAIGDYFGFSLELRGHRALIGAHGAPDFGFESGAAYVYEFDGTAWSAKTKLHAPDAAPNARFGFSVALGMDDVLVGAPLALGTGGAGAEPGVAYAFDVPEAPTSYGAGCAGSTWSTPKLGVLGCATAGGQVGLRIQGGTPGARVLVLIGKQQAAITLPNGCTQLVAPILLTLKLPPIGADGTSMGLLSIPSAAQPGWTYTLQAFLGDASSGSNFATSNGVEIVLQ